MTFYATVTAVQLLSHCTNLPYCFLAQLIMHLSLVCLAPSLKMICEGIRAIVTAAHLGESRLTQALLMVYLKAVPSCLVLHGAMVTLLRVLELASSKIGGKVCTECRTCISCLHYENSLTQTNLSPKQSNMKSISKQDTKKAVQVSSCLSTERMTQPNWKCGCQWHYKYRTCPAWHCPGGAWSQSTWSIAGLNLDLLCDFGNLNHILF